MTDPSAATPSRHRRSYPDLRVLPWDDQDAAVREAWIEHVTPEERSFA